MATRPKDGPVKEKRGKSPSNIRHTDPTQRRKSPHPPSPDHQKPCSTTTSSNSSNVPNYLRPTISSRVETSKNSASSATKKPSTISTDKSTINRRRSLDNKPSPTSQILRGHTSPTSVEKNPRPTTTVKAKPVSALTKPLPEKVAKAFSKDVGKPHSLYSRPVKTIKKNITSTTSASASNSTTKKHGSTSTNASATKAPNRTNDRSANIEDNTPKHEPLQEDHESSVTEPEEEEETGSNAAEVLIVEDKEHVDIQLHEADQSEETEESEEEVKKLPDSSTAYEEQKTTPVSEEPNAAPVVETEDTEPEEIHIDGPEIKDKEVEEEGKDENVDKNHHQQKESFESEPIVEVDNEKLKETEENPKEKGLEEKEVVDDEGNKGRKPEHDTQEVEEVAEEVKLEVNEVKPEVKEEKPEIKEVKKEVKEEKPEIKELKPEEMHKMLVSKPQANKKDNTAYNDVIEETASKLREQRRNKVKALVGAFETVISLEDPESETPRGN